MEFLIDRGGDLCHQGRCPPFNTLIEQVLDHVLLRRPPRGSALSVLVCWVGRAVPVHDEPVSVRGVAMLAGAPVALHVLGSGCVSQSVDEALSAFALGPLAKRKARFRV
jgi:hypothetical protein